MGKHKLAQKWTKKEEILKGQEYFIMGGPLNGYTIYDSSGSGNMVDYYENMWDAIHKRNELNGKIT